MRPSLQTQLVRNRVQKGHDMERMPQGVVPKYMRPRGLGVVAGGAVPFTETMIWQSQHAPLAD